MPINFPYPPSLNQLYSYDGKTWEWNGIYWEVYSALTSYITSAYTAGDGYSDISGVTGGNIVLKSFSGVNITIIDDGNKLTFSGNNGNITGSGTTNYLPKWTDSTGLGNSQIYDDGTNVGIGTTFPSSKLDVSITGGTIGVRISGDSSSDMLRLTQTGGGNAIVVEDSSNPDSTPFVVAADGRVGIGVTAPLSSYKLHVRSGTATSSAAAAGTVALFENSGNTYVSAVSPDANVAGFAFGSATNRTGTLFNWSYSLNRFAVTTNNVGAYMWFGTSDQQERMRIDASGNTGINVTSPTEKLHVSGNTLIQGSLTATTKTTIGSESNISSALLQMASTTQGILFPRMTNTQRESIISPVPGLFVYCTDFPEGLFMYKSTGWVQIM